VSNGHVLVVLTEQFVRFDGARWQARVNDDWRFYYRPEGDTYFLLDIIPHPK
jgi:hypothetical protein